jgi:hypothetical protein
MLVAPAVGPESQTVRVSYFVSVSSSGGSTAVTSYRTALCHIVVTTWLSVPLIANITYNI